MIRLSRLRYCGHVLRMNDHRLPKQIMYSEADLGERSRGRPKKNFRGCIKEDLKSFRIWEECSRTNIATMASDRSSWKAKINSGASLHQLTCSPGKIKEQKILKKRKTGKILLNWANSKYIFLFCYYCLFIFRIHKLCLLLIVADCLRG